MTFPILQFARELMEAFEILRVYTAGKNVTKADFPQ